MTDNFSDNPEHKIFSAEFPCPLREDYKRPPPIENQIRDVLRLSENDFSVRLRLKNSSSDKYLKGETLICLLALARAEGLFEIENSIAAKLAQICENLVRKFLRAQNMSENFIDEAVGELVFEMFAQILGREEKSYDFWEVNFYVSLQRLTSNYLRKHGGKALRTDTFSELSNTENENEFDFESSLRKYEALTIEERLLLKEILGKMSDEHRQIFRLYHVDGWTQQQIAEIFGFTTRTVRTRLKDTEEFLQEFRRGGEK